MPAPRTELYSEANHGHLIPALTELLHAAYGALAAQGMRYWASHQTPADTRYRLGQGEAYLAFVGESLAGTISLCGPEETSESAFYRRPGVYSFRQFGVAPAYQGRGVGDLLLAKAEERARALGATHLALDTSERAQDLIALYGRRGYLFQEFVQWEGGVNYRSVIMAKPLRE